MVRFVVEVEALEGTGLDSALGQRDAQLLHVEQVGHLVLVDHARRVVEVGPLAHFESCTVARVCVCVWLGPPDNCAVQHKRGANAPFLPPRGKEMRLSVVPGTMDVVIRFLFFGPGTMEAASECLGNGAEPHTHTHSTYPWC